MIYDLLRHPAAVTVFAVFYSAAVHKGPLCLFVQLGVDLAEYITDNETDVGARRYFLAGIAREKDFYQQVEVPDDCIP